MPTASKIEDICSYIYTKLAGIDLDPEPDVESDDVEFAMESLGNIDGLLGPTPINKDTLSAAPHVYAKHIWMFLQEMEEATLQVPGSQVVDKCDMRWLRMELNEYVEFKSLTRRKQKMVSKSVLEISNGDDPYFTIRYQLDSSFIDALTNIINTTRLQLEYSKLFLSGMTFIDLDLCLPTVE